MELKVINGVFSICRVKDFSQIDSEHEFVFTAKTDEEISLVCPSELVPDNAYDANGGWRAFRIEGVLDFSLIGILANISSVLAESGIGIFVISTYNTDYVLTKGENIKRAVEALKEKGYRIIE